MAFWQVILLFSSIGALFLLWPLIRSSFYRAPQSNEVEYDQTQVELYQEHLADFDKSFTAGDIDQKQYDELKVELQKTLIAEGAIKSVVKVNHGGKKVMLVCAFCIPVVCFVLYQRWGAEKDWNIYQAIEQLSTVNTQEEHTSKMRGLVVEIQQRLKQRPDDMQLRGLLGQLSMVLQDYDKAVESYRFILNEYPEDPKVISKLAQALFSRAGGVVTPEVKKYTQKALSIAPMLPEMLGLAGIDAKNQGDFRKAINYWESAVRFMDPNSSTAKGYQSGIANAKKALADAGEGVEVSEVANSNPTSDQVAPVNKTVTLNISLAESSIATGTETLYVYARAWKGAKIPLAIQKMPVSNLPLSITLDESMAMAPGMTITSFPKLEVVARISQSGGPISQAGDWQASFGPVVLSELKEPIDLVISEQLK